MPEPIIDPQTGFPLVVHSQTLAALCGFDDDKQLRNLAADGVLPPRVDRATWPTWETLRRLIRHYRDKAKTREKRSDDDLEKKLDRARLRKLDLANAKTAREVINVEEARRAHADVLMVFVQRAEDMPDKLAAALENRPADYIRDTLKKEIRLLREALAQQPDYRFEEVNEEDADEDDEDDESAS